MGKTEKQGGGGLWNRERKIESEKCWFSNVFSTKFFSFSHSQRFGFTLVELLVVIAIISLKSLKIRNMTMENLVICLVGLFAFFYANCRMLKWARQRSKGGGGIGIER
jgi:prepilin-type N-terminal cleavage/methylation domain-containing protein